MFVLCLHDGCPLLLLLPAGGGVSLPAIFLRMVPVQERRRGGGGGEEEEEGGGGGEEEEEEELGERRLGKDGEGQRGDDRRHLRQCHQCQWVPQHFNLKLERPAGGGAQLELLEQQLQAEVHNTVTHNTDTATVVCHAVHIRTHMIAESHMIAARALYNSHWQWKGWIQKRKQTTSS